MIIMELQLKTLRHQSYGMGPGLGKRKGFTNQIISKQNQTKKTPKKQKTTQLLRTQSETVIGEQKLYLQTVDVLKNACP